MKKTLFLLLVALLTTCCLKAQEQGDLNFSFRGGVILSDLTGSKDAETKVGVGYGINLFYGFTDLLAAGLDVSVDRLGAHSVVTDKNMNLRYISVTPTLKLYATKWLAFHAGPQFNFLNSARMNGISFWNQTRKFGVSLPVGVSFEPNLKLFDDDDTLILDVRFQFGLTHANRSGVIADNLHSNALMISIGYKFNFLE